MFHFRWRGHRKPPPRHRSRRPLRTTTAKATEAVVYPRTRLCGLYMRPEIWPFILSLIPPQSVAVVAQPGQTLLGIPSLNGFNLQPSSSPMLYILPPSAPSITVSVALCSVNTPLPRVFVNNSTTPGPTVGPGDPQTYEITFEDGVGVWTGEAPTGATIAAYVGDGATATSVWQFEIGVQEGDGTWKHLPITKSRVSNYLSLRLPALSKRVVYPCRADPPHDFDTNLPILSDTASTQAIVYTPTFQNITIAPPSYPNYTLPSLNPFADLPPPNYLPPSSIVILNTPTQLSSLPYFRSSCALRALQGASAFNASQTNVIRSGQTGWQTEFFVPSGLAPSTNYTVWMTQGPKVSGPIYMRTKSAQFSETCSFVHALPYCPLVSYPIPIPLPQSGVSPPALYDASTLPTDIAGNITSSISNFQIILSTFPCGRDVYSPLHDCFDCMNAYRTWACFVSFPRCTEPDPSLPPTASMTDQTEFPFALKTIPASTGGRAAGFPNATAPYVEILPCMESCNAVHRNCPPFIQWQCPNPRVNANESYALGVLDDWDGDDEGKGILGGGLNAAGIAIGRKSGGSGVEVRGVVDPWGNVWCNGA